MIVISNSSPLIALGSIDRLDLLFQLFEMVYIPEAVYQETVQENHVLEQRKRIDKAVHHFIRIKSSKTHLYGYVTPVS